MSKFIKRGVFILLCDTMGGLSYSFLKKASICSVLALLLIPASISTLAVGQQQGWVEDYEGITILHLNGTFYDMGYQHGSLLSEEVAQNLRAYFSFAESGGTSYEELQQLWVIMEPFTPPEIIEEMQGIADGANLDFEQIAVANIIPVKYHCSGMAAWGPATVDGKLYHMRSLDYPLSIKDPETDVCLQENQLIIVRQPAHGYASMYPAFAGFAGSVGGINERGIGIGQSSSGSRDETYYGMPMTFRVKYVLDHAASAEEAIDIITTNRTVGHNFIISDASVPVGYAVETTAHHWYAGTWNNFVESTFPCWSIDSLVRRTNFFVSPETAATQRDSYNPIGIIRYLLGSNPYYPYWRHYRSLSLEMNKHWGNLDVNDTMTMLRTVYQGDTDILIRLVVYTGFLQTMHQWVACPETGDFAFSFADVDDTKNAFTNPVHHLNLFDLLEE